MKIEKTDLKIFQRAIDFYLMRNSYSKNLVLDELINKLKTSINLEHSSTEEKHIMLEILNENINHISKYSYPIDLTYQQREKLRNEALLPLQQLKNKLTL